jgi:hypothetical protein
LFICFYFISHKKSKNISFLGNIQYFLQKILFVEKNTEISHNIHKTHVFQLRRGTPRLNNSIMGLFFGGCGVLGGG